MKYIFLLLFLVSCEQVSAAKQRADTEEIHYNWAANKSIVQEEMTYHKDPRTDLCFAAWRHWGTEGLAQTITNVPCTDKVEKLIK